MSSPPPVPRAPTRAVTLALAILLGSPALASRRVRRAPRVEPASTPTLATDPAPAVSAAVAPIPPALAPETAPAITEGSEDTPARGLALSGGIRAGALAPFGFLHAGPEVGAALEALPLAAPDFRADLFVGYLGFQRSAPRMIEGRGLDVGFTEYLSAIPVELWLGYRLWGRGAASISFGVGTGLYFTRASFIAFSQASRRERLGSTALAAIHAELPVGQGAMQLSVGGQVGSVSLGTLGAAGADQLTGLLVSVSYLFPISVLGGSR